LERSYRHKYLWSAIYFQNKIQGGIREIQASSECYWLCFLSIKSLSECQVNRSMFLKIICKYSYQIFLRALELAFIFLLVWYYCTLTIRESILKVNGSRIKGWWRIHHFISTVAAGVLLIWPNSETWYHFRSQFMWFNLYISKIKCNNFFQLNST
jgi:TMPIT-like protein